jgi:hypothetical protein
LNAVHAVGGGLQQDRLRRGGRPPSLRRLHLQRRRDHDPGVNLLELCSLCHVHACFNETKLFYVISYGITKYCQVYAKYLLVLCRYFQVSPGITKYGVWLSIGFVQYILGCSKFLSNIVGIVRYHQVLPGIVNAQKSILMIRFLTVISRYFTVLVLDC